MPTQALAHCISIGDNTLFDFGTCASKFNYYVLILIYYVLVIN